MDKLNIAVVYGGPSSERQISIQSGRYVASVLDRAKYNVYEVLFDSNSWLMVEWDGDEMKTLGEVNRSDFSACGVKFDAAFVTIHGIPGENGLLQGYFEMVQVPFNTCSSFVCTVAFNKYSCKRFIADTGVRMAKDVFLQKGCRYDAAEIVEQLGLPLFVKPSDGGSSFGVTKVKEASRLSEAIAVAFKESDSVLIESAVVGREGTQGVYMADGETRLLPITEIVSENEYFDFEAKYLGKSNEICPAPIPDTLAEEISGWSRKIYEHLGCTGLIRIDYIVSQDGIYFLEINTTPGMTQASIVPKMVRAAKLDITDFLSQITDNCLSSSSFERYEASIKNVKS